MNEGPYRMSELPKRETASCQNCFYASGWVCDGDEEIFCQRWLWPEGAVGRFRDPSPQNAVELTVRQYKWCGEWVHKETLEPLLEWTRRQRRGEPKEEQDA